MSYVIRIIGLATGEPSEIDGTFIESYTDSDGRGHLVTTPNRETAMQFEDARSVLAFWKQTSEIKPLRDDGEPNRPLTSYTVALEQ